MLSAITAEIAHHLPTDIHRVAGASGGRAIFYEVRERSLPGLDSLIDCGKRLGGEIRRNAIMFKGHSDDEGRSASRVIAAFVSQEIDVIGFDSLLRQRGEDLRKGYFPEQGFAEQFAYKRFIHRFLLFNGHLPESVGSRQFAEQQRQTLALGIRKNAEELLVVFIRQTCQPGNIWTPAG